jgi:hypothetical protein
MLEGLVHAFEKRWVRGRKSSLHPQRESTTLLESRRGGRRVSAEGNMS